MSRINHLNRFLAGVITVTFFVTNTLTPAPIAHAMPAGSQVQSVEAPSFVSSFRIPEAFGKVREIVPASSQAPVLIHIQEAHANYDAQKNIRGILQHLSRDYGVDLILMEGAGYKLAPELFRFFPADAKLQHESNRKLMQAGELTGAEVFLMDAPAKTEGWGVEDAATYSKDRDAFKTVFEGRESENAFLDSFYIHWQSQAASVLNKELREFLARYLAYEDGQSPLADWLEVLKEKAHAMLGLELSDASSQAAWPTLVRYFRLKKVGAEIDLKKSESEKKKFLAENPLPLSVVNEIEQVFASAQKGPLPVYETRFVFERMMESLPEKFSFAAFPNLRLHIQQMVLMSELQSETLQQEIRMLAKSLVEAAAKTEAERKHVALLREYQLLKKLFRLELSREEYQQVVLRKVCPKSLVSDVSPAIQALYKAGLDFYEGAILREDFMMKKALERMKARKQTKAVLITGGFHTDGLKEKITSSGNSYIGITPNIGEVPADSQKNYLAALLGQELIAKAHIAPEVRSEVRFWQEASPQSWRREFAGAGARISGIVQQVSPEGVAAVRRNFIAAAVSFRSESKEVTASGRVLAEGSEEMTLASVAKSLEEQKLPFGPIVPSAQSSSPAPRTEFHGMRGELVSFQRSKVRASRGIMMAGLVALASILMTVSVKAQTVFPGKPKLETYGSGGSGSITQYNSRRFLWNHSVMSDAWGSWTSATMNFLSSGGTQNLSSFNEFQFKFRGYNDHTTGSQAVFTVEFQDAEGDAAKKFISGIYNDQLQTVTIPKASLEIQPGATVNWDRIKAIAFVVNNGSMMPRNFTGWLEVETGGLYFSANVAPDADLTPHDTTRLPDGGQPTTVAPYGATATATRTANGIRIDYDNYINTWSGGGLTYDDGGTPSIETGNLSSLENLVLTVRGNPTQVKMELVDLHEIKESVNLTQVAGANQCWSLPLDNYFASVDRSKIKVIYFIIEGAGQKGTLYVDHIPVTPDIAAVNSGANGASVTFKSFAGASYRIQYRNDLSDPEWHDAETVIAAGPQTTWTDNDSRTGGLSAKRFYRVVYSRSESRSLDDGIIPYLEAYGRFAGRENSHRGWQESMEALGGYDALWSIFNDEILTTVERDIVAKLMAYGRGYVFQGWQDMTEKQKHEMLAGWNSVGIEIPEKLKRDTEIFNRFMLGMLGAMGIWWPIEASLKAIFPELVGVGAQALSLSLSTAIVFGLLRLNDLSTARATARKKAAAQQALPSNEAAPNQRASTAAEKVVRSEARELPALFANTEALRSFFQAYVSQFDARERKILTYRTQMEGGESWTTARLARELKTTTGGARPIELKALAKARYLLARTSKLMNRRIARLSDIFDEIRFFQNESHAAGIAENAIRAAGIVDLNELCRKTRKQFSEYENVGVKVVANLEEALSAYGRTFGSEEVVELNDEQELRSALLKVSMALEGGEAVAVKAAESVLALEKPVATEILAKLFQLSVQITSGEVAIPIKLGSLAAALFFEASQSGKERAEVRGDVDAGMSEATRKFQRAQSIVDLAQAKALAAEALAIYKELAPFSSAAKVNVGSVKVFLKELAAREKQKKEPSKRITAGAEVTARNLRARISDLLQTSDTVEIAMTNSSIEAFFKGKVAKLDGAKAAASGNDDERKRLHLANEQRVMEEFFFPAFEALAVPVAQVVQDSREAGSGQWAWIFKGPVSLEQLKVLLNVGFEFDFRIFKTNRRGPYIFLTKGSGLPQAWELSASYQIRSAQASSNLFDIPAQAEGHSHPRNKTAEPSRGDYAVVQEKLDHFILMYHSYKQELEMTLLDKGMSEFRTVRGEEEIAAELSRLGLVSAVTSATLTSASRRSEMREEAFGEALKHYMDQYRKFAGEENRNLGISESMEALGGYDDMWSIFNDEILTAAERDIVAKMMAYGRGYAFLGWEDMSGSQKHAMLAGWKSVGIEIPKKLKRDTDLFNRFMLGMLGAMGVWWPVEASLKAVFPELTGVGAQALSLSLSTAIVFGLLRLNDLSTARATAKKQAAKVAESTAVTPLTDAANGKSTRSEIRGTNEIDKPAILLRGVEALLKPYLGKRKEITGYDLGFRVTGPTIVGGDESTAMVSSILKEVFRNKAVKFERLNSLPLEIAKNWTVSDPSRRPKRDLVTILAPDFGDLPAMIDAAKKLVASDGLIVVSLAKLDTNSFLEDGGFRGVNSQKDIRKVLSDFRVVHLMDRSIKRLWPDTSGAGAFVFIYSPKGTDVLFAPQEPPAVFSLGDVPVAQGVRRTRSETRRTPREKNPGLVSGKERWSFSRKDIGEAKGSVAEFLEKRGVTREVLSGTFVTFKPRASQTPYMIIIDNDPARQGLWMVDSLSSQSGVQGVEDLEWLEISKQKKTAPAIHRSEVRELIELMVMPAMVLGVIGLATFISRHWERHHNLKKNRVAYEKYREAVMALDPENSMDQQVLYALRWLLTKRQPAMRVIQDPGDQKRYKLWVDALAKATDAVSVKAVLASLVVERRPNLAAHPEGIFFVEEVFEYVPLTKIVLDLLATGDPKFTGFSMFLEDAGVKSRWRIDPSGHQLRFEPLSGDLSISSQSSAKKTFPSLKKVLIAGDGMGKTSLTQLVRDLAPDAQVTFVEVNDQELSEMWKKLRKGSYDLMLLDGDVIPWEAWDRWTTDVLAGASAGQPRTPLVLLTARPTSAGMKTKIGEGFVSGVLEKPRETFLDWSGKPFLRFTAQHAKSLSDLLEQEGIRPVVRSEVRKEQTLATDETLVFGKGEFRLVMDSPYEGGAYVLLQSQNTNSSVDGKIAPKVPAQGLPFDLTAKRPLTISRGSGETPVQISFKRTEGSRVFLGLEIPEDMNFTVLDASYRERKDRKEHPTYMTAYVRKETVELNPSSFARSESREADELFSWAQKNAPELADYTVVSRQLEAGLSRDILDKLTEKFGKETAGLVAATTVTGGLGALMHDLFPSWQKNFGESAWDPQDLDAIIKREKDARPADAFTVNVIYDEIKGQRFAKNIPEDVKQGKKTLGDYLRAVLTENPEFRQNIFMEPGPEFRSKADEWIARATDPLYKKRLQQVREAVDHEIHVKVYPTKTSVGGIPNFYVEAYYIDAYGAKVQIFDEVYPDAPYGGPNLWRDFQMAVYGRITETLTLNLQEKGLVKKNILFVDNEAFVSIPTPLLPDAIHHHMNHSVFAPTIYSPDAVSLELLGYQKTSARYIVRNGKISIINGLGSGFDLVTGVALYEHTPAVAGGVLPGYVDIVDSYNQDGLRSTNGVLLEQWQAPLLRGLIDSYKEKFGMAPGVDDKDFFARLNDPANQEMLRSFQERTDLIKSFLAGRLILWLKESQGQPLWFDEAMKAYQEKTGDSEIQGDWLLVDLQRRIQTALENEAEWDALLEDPKVQALQQEFLKTAIVSNVRRQVSYKGPDKWREILRSLKADPAKLAWYKKHAARAILGGREFGPDAHEVFVEIQGLVKELGLEDKFATIENYNIEVAPVIFQGVSATVMITYEVLEASATSMMKGLPNGAVLIMAWGGAGPELFSIKELATGREVNIFKEKVTYEQLVEKIHSGEWKITNGFLVEYSSEGDKKFILDTLGFDGKIKTVNARFPVADSMIAALASLQDQYQNPEERRTLEWEALKSSIIVDMEKSQARAHMKLWQRVIQKKNKQKEVFGQSKLSPENALKFLSQGEGERGGFVWRNETTGALEIAGPGLFDFIESARQIRTHAAEGYRSIAYHAVRGDIFNKIFSYLDGFREVLPGFYQEMLRLKEKAETTQDLFEKVQATFAALRLFDRFAAQLSESILQGYLQSRGRGYEKLFQNALFRQNLYFYLESKGQKFGSLNQSLAGFAVEENGEKYIVALNLGEPKYPGVEGGEPKAWGQFYGDTTFQWLTGQLDPESGMTYEVVDVITGEVYGDGDDRRPYPFWALTRGALPVGVPSPDIQILKLRATGEVTLGEPKKQPKKQPEMFILDDLRALVSGDPRDQVRQQKPRSYWLKRTVTYLLRNDPEDLKARLKKISTMDREKAITSFGAEGVRRVEGVRPVMAFIAGLFPELLEDMKDWDPEVYEALKEVMGDPALKDLFEKGEVFLNDASRDTAFVITRTLKEKAGDPTTGRHVVIPIHFSKMPYNKEEGKVWFGFGNINRLGLRSGTVYQTWDWMLKTLYSKKHTLATLSKEGWRVGIPVVKRKDPAEIQQNGWRFQVLQMLPVGVTRSDASGDFDEDAFGARSESRDNPSEGPTPLVAALLGFALEGMVFSREKFASSLVRRGKAALGIRSAPKFNDPKPLSKKPGTSVRSESRLGEVDIPRIEAALRHVISTSTDAGTRKTAELFLNTGLISPGRKGFEELNRAEAFLKSLNPRSESRELDASDVMVTRERGALHIVVGEASVDVTTLNWEEGQEPGKVVAAFLAEQGLNASVSDKSSSEVIVGGHPVFLDWEKREEFHLWELRDAIVREVQKKNARSEMRATEVWPQHQGEKVAVVGAAGFVGATEASMLSARFGHDVAGVDVKATSVASLNGGKLVNYAPGLEAFLQDGLHAERLHFTTKLADAIEGREFVFLALPTPYLPNGQSDTRFLEDAIGDIARLMKPGERKIVIGKSTAPPSTIDKLKARIKQVGLPEGAEIELAWIPEFLREGLEVEDALGGSGRMVVGAEKPAIADRVASLYARENINPEYPGKPIPIIKMGIRSAMLVKYGANGYRATKISESNYVSWLTASLGFDINEISDRVGADPRIRRSFLSAGIGWGGSCFPKDSLSFMRQLVEAGMPYGLMLDTFMVNELQWEAFAEEIKERLDGVKDKTIVILGGAFKPETSDDRESRANLIIRRLVEWGAKVRVFDPEAIPFLKRSLADLNTAPGSGKESPVTYYSDPGELYAMMEGSQAIALVTEWGLFREINFKKVQQMFPEKRPLVFDGRNAWDPEEVKGFGFEYFGISHIKVPSSFVGGPAALVRSQDEFAAKMVEFFLALRIAFVNSLAELAERSGADIRDVLKGLGADPVVGDAYLKPGIGFGGFDLFAALDKVTKLTGLSSDSLKEMMQRYRSGLSTMKRHFGFPETEEDSKKIPYVSPILEGNDRAIALHVEKAREAVGGDLKGKQIAILGMAYKPGETSSIENAPSLKLIELLRAQGAIVRVTDAHPVTGASVRNYFAAHAMGTDGVQFFDDREKNAVENAREAVRGSDAQILVTEWPEYANWKNIFFEKEAGKKTLAAVTTHLSMVDGRHFYDPAEMTANGFRYLAVGIPTQQEAKTVVLPEQEKESLGKSIQFPEKTVRIEGLEAGRFRASLRLNMSTETFGSTSFYGHFGPRAKGAFVPPWHDKEIPVEQIAHLEDGSYELTVELDANEFPQFVDGEFGATFFALPSDITEQDAGFYTDRVWVKQYGQVDDGVFQASARSESRNFFHPEWITGQRMSVMTLEGFFRFNKEQQAGGSEKAVRSFSDQVMGGIYPLLANTLNVIEKLIPAVTRLDWVKTSHAAAAQRVLGLVPDGSYAFILGSDLALAKDKGMLALAKTIYSGSSFAILEKDTAKIPAIRKFLAAEGLQERVFVFAEASLAAAALRKSGISLKAMISSEELMLADEIEKALDDKPMVMNESMRKRFLNAAGQLFQSLADRIAGQFALARSA